MSTELRRARSRQMVIFLLVCLGIMVLLGRLYYWQIVMGGDLAQQANAEHIQNQVLNAPRGLIYDAEGRLLATNVVRDDVYIEPSSSRLISLITIRPNEMISFTRYAWYCRNCLLTNYKKLLCQVFRRCVSPEAIDPDQSQRLHGLQLPDIFLQSRTVRTYPDSDIDAQILGYVQLGW